MRVRFTIRWLMAAVALVALALGGFVAGSQTVLTRTQVVLSPGSVILLEPRAAPWPAEDSFLGRVMVAVAAVAVIVGAFEVGRWAERDRAARARLAQVLRVSRMARLQDETLTRWLAAPDPPETE